MRRLKEIARQRSVDKVQRENIFLKERLDKIKPYYSKKIFDDSYEHHKTFLRGRCCSLPSPRPSLTSSVCVDELIIPLDILLNAQRSYKLVLFLLSPIPSLLDLPYQIDLTPLWRDYLQSPKRDLSLPMLRIAATQSSHQVILSTYLKSRLNCALLSLPGPTPPPIPPPSSTTEMNLVILLWMQIC